MNGCKIQPNTDCKGAKLAGADLHDANLSGANLEGADLTGTNLMSSNLTNANLSGAKVWFTDMQSADLTGAKTTGAEFANANLIHATCPDGSGPSTVSAPTSDVSWAAKANRNSDRHCRPQHEPKHEVELRINEGSEWSGKHAQAVPHSPDNRVDDHHARSDDRAVQAQ